MKGSIRNAAEHDTGHRDTEVMYTRIFLHHLTHGVVKV